MAEKRSVGWISSNKSYGRGQLPRLNIPPAFPFAIPSSKRTEEPVEIGKSADSQHLVSRRWPVRAGSGTIHLQRKLLLPKRRRGDLRAGLVAADHTRHSERGSHRRRSCKCGPIVIPSTGQALRRGTWVFNSTPPAAAPLLRSFDPRVRFFFFFFDYTFHHAHSSK